MAKAFNWSYSKLKNFRTCPYKYEQVDILKKYKETSEQLAWGSKVHAALEAALKHGTPLPAQMQPWQKWVTMVKRLPGQLLVEQKYALMRDFQPCEYFSPAVWYRARGDAVVVDGERAAALDWKTGRQKHDSVQLMLLATCVFAYHPEVKKIKATFVWLPDDCTTSDDYTPDDIAKAWKNGLLDEVAELEQAAQTQHYPKRPSGLCVNFCQVLDCEFLGKGTPR
jgi:hypothetical protein